VPKIENQSMINIKDGVHRLEARNSILIQITDPDRDFVEPQYKNDFIKIYQFKFYDVTEPLWGRGLIEPITQDQADEIFEILLNAYDIGVDVLVHCYAGLCRSGAVVEVGTIMGFEAVHENRIPNVEVKSKLLRAMRERLYA